MKSYILPLIYSVTFNFRLGCSCCHTEQASWILWVRCMTLLQPCLERWPLLLKVKHWYSLDSDTFFCESSPVHDQNRVLNVRIQCESKNVEFNVFPCHTDMKLGNLFDWYGEPKVRVYNTKHLTPKLNIHFLRILLTFTNLGFFCWWCQWKQGPYLKD